VLANSPSAIRALGHDMDLQALDAFAERRAEKVRPPGALGGVEAVGRSIANFQNQPDRSGAALAPRSHENLRRSIAALTSWQRCDLCRRADH